MKYALIMLSCIGLAAPAFAEGDIYVGQKRFTICRTCHGTDGMGLESVGTPRLAGQKPYYLKRQLMNFQSGARGTTPGDDFGKMMRPMAMTLPDEQAIDDVIAYIETLSSD